MTKALFDDVTVIVPTRNEADNIVRFLSSLPETVHLIVVDSSDDATPELIARHRPWRTEVITAEVNIPEARQIGAEAATTPWLLYTDADVTFHPRYFETLAAMEIGSNVGGIIGVKSTVDGFDRYHRWFCRAQGFMHQIGIPAASGSNMMLRRSVLHQLGGFDPMLTVNEDTEVMFRVAKAGYDVLFCEELRVQSFDHRRLEAGMAYKVLHGAVRNSALWLGVFETQVRSSDWGYWNRSAQRPAEMSR